MFSLQVEEPKPVKGLSSMIFTVKQWKEKAISDDRQSLIEYAHKAGYKKNHQVWRVVER